jgi:hypothetical protein
MTMPVWPALLLAPSLALAELSLLLALATPICATQNGHWLHVLSLAFVLAGLALTAVSWREVRRLKREYGGSVPTDTDRHGPQQLFLARVATWSGVLSSLVLFALWIPQWVLSPCWS